MIYVTNFGLQPQPLEINTCLAEATEVDKIGPASGANRPDAEEEVVKELFRKQIISNLTVTETDEVMELLYKYRSCFVKSGARLGQTEAFQHEIPTTTLSPINVRPYPNAWKERQIIQQQVQEMLDLEVIQPSFSPWSAPVVLVKKKDGTWRFCIDYRKLNSVTRKTVYPLPRIDESLSRLEGSHYFTSLDLQSGYWQIAVNPSDREKTAFTTADGHYEIKAMPFGLSGAAHTFQRAMDVILRNLKWTA